MPSMPVPAVPRTLPRAIAPLASTLDDWRRSLHMSPLWTSLALEDLRDRYRRTALGLLWIVISFALFVLV